MPDEMTTPESKFDDVQAAFEFVSAENLLMMGIEHVLNAADDLESVDKMTKLKIMNYIETTMGTYLDHHLQHVSNVDNTKFLVGFNKQFQVVKTELVYVANAFIESCAEDWVRFNKSKKKITKVTSGIDANPDIGITEESLAAYTAELLGDFDDIWGSHREFSKNVVQCLNGQFKSAFQHLDELLTMVQARKVIEPAE